MVETLDFTPIYLQDLAIGVGQREVRLQDQRVVLLDQIHLGVLVPYATYIRQPGVGSALITVAGALPAGHRIWGVTAYITRTFGASQGLTSLMIGDAFLADRWGTMLSVTTETETDQTDFANGDMPIYATDTAVLVTASGGLFDGTGEIELQVHSSPLVHRRA